MNVYDFDNTIYDGESAVDFFLFCLRRYPRLIKLLPLITVKLMKYKLCMITSEELTEYVEKYAGELLLSFGNPDALIREFWDKNMKKIKDFYINQKQPDDIILSASFSILLSEPAKRLGIKNMITSEIDRETGKITRLCFRENKARLLKEAVPDGAEITFYTDSMNDKAMIDFADVAFFVKGNRVKRIK